MADVSSGYQQNMQCSTKHTTFLTTNFQVRKDTGSKGFQENHWKLPQLFENYLKCIVPGSLTVKAYADPTTKQVSAMVPVVTVHSFSKVTLGQATSCQKFVTVVGILSKISVSEKCKVYLLHLLLTPTVPLLSPNSSTATRG